MKSRPLTAVVTLGCLLLVGCGGAASSSAPPAAAPAPPSAGVRFTKKLPVVGSVSLVRERNETRMAMDITVDGVATQASEDAIETVERRTEVLATGSDGAETRVKVTYTANHKEETGKGVVVSAVEGKTYMVEGRGDKAPSRVTDAAGNPASAEEAEVLAHDFKHLGRIDPVWRALPEQPLAAGAPVDAMAKAILDDEADEGLEKVQLHFEGKRDVAGGPGGVFAVALTGKLLGETPSTINGKVTLLLANGWEAESDAQAPVEMSQKGTRNGKTFAVVAHGTVHLHKETSYVAR
jgi:hypothetical protein